MTSVDTLQSVKPGQRREEVATAPAQLTSALLFLQFAAFVVTLGVLGSAINWPASLEDPASVVLPLIKTQSSAVQVGYSAYLFSALLLIPIAFMLRSLLAAGGGLLLNIAAFLGATAGVLKMFGIARWLVLMPTLADSYGTSAGVTDRNTLTIVYNAFNKYAGGIGEVFGVMLFAGLWTGLVAIAVLQSRQLPTWVGYGGLIAAITLLVGLVQIFGLTLGPIYLTVSGAVWQVWMIALGVALFRRRKELIHLP